MHAAPSVWRPVDSFSSSLSTEWASCLPKNCVSFDAAYPLFLLTLVNLNTDLDSPSFQLLV